MGALTPLVNGYTESVWKMAEKCQVTLSSVTSCRVTKSSVTQKRMTWRSTAGSYREIRDTSEFRPRRAVVGRSTNPSFCRKKSSVSISFVGCDGILALLTINDINLHQKLVYTEDIPG